MTEHHPYEFDALTDSSRHEALKAATSQSTRSNRREAALLVFLGLVVVCLTAQSSSAVRNFWSSRPNSTQLQKPLDDVVREPLEFNVDPLNRTVYKSDLPSQSLQEQLDDVVREPLSLYMDPVNRTVYRNDHVRGLMDFAMLGHPKCATTFLKDALFLHPEISMYNEELRMLQGGDIAGMTEALYKLDPTKKRGYKSPNHISRKRALDSIRIYWPHTKLILGVRSPVEHFESWYNYVVVRESFVCSQFRICS